MESKRYWPSSNYDSEIPPLAFQPQNEDIRWPEPPSRLSLSRISLVKPGVVGRSTAPPQITGTSHPLQSEHTRSRSTTALRPEPAKTTCDRLQAAQESDRHRRSSHTEGSHSQRHSNQMINPAVPGP